MNKTNVVNFPGKKRVSTTLPAIYTFVFTTLIGPAIAAAILGVIYLISGALGLGPPSIKALKAGELLPYTAVRALDAYIWSAIPAALTGVTLAGVVHQRGGFPWLIGVMVAAIFASIVAVLSGGQAAGHVYFIALIAAATAVLGRSVLAVARVVR